MGVSCVVATSNKFIATVIIIFLLPVIVYLDWAYEQSVIIKKCLLWLSSAVHKILRAFSYDCSTWMMFTMFGGY